MMTGPVFGTLSPLMTSILSKKLPDAHWAIFKMIVWATPNGMALAVRYVGDKG